MPKVKSPISKRVNYRKLAFAHYKEGICAYCGFGIREVLEVCHLDCQRSNNAITNLVILCPTCHRMHDLDLISTATIIHMRNRKRRVLWAKRIKDAGRKAAESRKRRKAAFRRKWQLAGLKAARTREKNKISN